MFELSFLLAGAWLYEEFVPVVVAPAVELVFELEVKEFIV
jgi:hypothetical protein